MSTMPIGWALATVGDVADLADGPFGSNLKTAHYTAAGPRVIRLQNIGHGRFRDDRAHITLEHFERLTKHSVHPSDVVAASLGEDAPRACLIPPWLGPAIVKADCIRVRTLDAIEPAFLMWMLNSPPVRAQAAKSIKGVGRPRLGLGGMRRLAIPVPPRTEQRRIVAAIEEQFSRIDSGSETLRRARKGLMRLRDAIMHQAFGGDWPMVPTGDVAEVQGGIQKQPKRRPVHNKAPFLRVANVLRGRLDLTDVHEVELFAGERERYCLAPGDLLVVEGNGSVEQIGRSALWQGEISDCVHQNHLIRVRPGPGLVPAFLAGYWNSPVTRRRLAGVASSTSGLYTLSTAKVKSVPVPVLPVGQQRKVLVELDLQLSIVDALAVTIEHSLLRATVLTRSILEKAFSGELVPQDPFDEPASVLLDDIAADRAAGSKALRRGRKLPA